MKILDIYKNILLEDFKTQRKKFIEQGYEPNIVDTYLKDFDEIRNGKFREARESEIQGLNVPKGDARFNVDSYKTFRELEILVDFVAGQRKVGSANFEDIKVDGEPIFRNEDVEIYYADTPRACIQYKGNFPYSWCVARNDSGNMFYNYRLREYEPSFYFVKLIKRTKKEFEYWNNEEENFSGVFKDEYHFFVVQVTKNNSYIVTSAINDNDKTMDWNQILNFAPELTELKQIFQPKPLSKEEREKIEKYQYGLSDEEFAKLPYKEKEFYLAVYVQIDKPITLEQFKILPEDLKNKYIGFGLGLSDEQFELIKDNKNLIKRYSEITKRKFDIFSKEPDSEITFTNSEHLFIQDKIYKLIDDNFETLSILNKIINKNNYKNIINYIFNDYKKINKINLSKISTIFDEKIKDNDFLLKQINNYIENLKNDESIKTVDQDITDILLYYFSNDLKMEENIYDIILKNDKFIIKENYLFEKVQLYLNNYYKKNYEEEEKQNIINNLIEKDRLIIGPNIFYYLLFMSNESNSLKLIKKYKKRFSRPKWFTPDTLRDYIEDKYVKLVFQNDELNEQITRIKKMISII